MKEAVKAFDAASGGADKPFRFYRDAGGGVDRRGRKGAAGRVFVAFLESPAGAMIFAKWGWKAP